MAFIRLFFSKIDFVLFLPALFLSIGGLATLYGFGETSSFFDKQIVWVALGVTVSCVLSFGTYYFLRRTSVVMIAYAVSLVPLVLVLLVGNVVKGAQSWFDLGFASFQPSDVAKLALILVLAKYFSKRHVEIKYVRHIVVSFIYAAIPVFLILLQPDLGSALVLMAIWFGMVFVSGISKKHLFAVGLSGVVVVLFAWFFVFEPYQKNRIMTFLNPLENVRTSGYNVYQSQIAIGSGQLSGKGVGLGTQSRLEFLPEHETDFIFAAFAEEWGFIGASLAVLLFAVLLLRILYNALLAQTNFETFFMLGVLFFFSVHIFVNVGMNVGLMPVTGIPLPFMSYGGSHTLIEWVALGIIMGMSTYNRSAHKGKMNYEFLGVE